MARTVWMVTVLLLMFAKSVSSLGGRDGQTASDSSVRQLPIKVRTMTVLVYPAMFAGQPVKVIDAVVRRSYGPTLLTVTEPHYRRYGTTLLHDSRDELLVVLPTAARLPEGAKVNVVGTVRTVLGLRASGDPRWPVDVDRRVLKRFAEALVLVADSVETLGGTELVSLGTPR
jgi:hypothetical protein